MPSNSRASRSDATRTKNLWNTETLSISEIGEYQLKLPENIKDLCSVKTRLDKTQLVIYIILGRLDELQKKRRNPTNTITDLYSMGYVGCGGIPDTCRYSKIKPEKLDRLIPIIEKLAATVNLRIEHGKRKTEQSNSASPKRRKLGFKL